MADKDIIKKYGSIFRNAKDIIETPPKVMSISPNVDIALGGGIPEGSFVVLTGIEKGGKTIMALEICASAQSQLGNKIYYENIEGRIKGRDLAGIKRLDHSDEKFKLIGSTEDTILSAEDYLCILDELLHTEKNIVGVVDSFSMLTSKNELTNDLTAVEVMATQKLQAKFCRKVSNVLPVKKNTVIGITQQMANVQKMGMGKAKVEKGGNALKYQADVKLELGWFEPLKDGEDIIGQISHWKVITSAIGPPGGTFQTYIRFGQGIWKERELADLLVSFGLAKKAGAWFTYGEDKFHGLNAFAAYFEDSTKYNESLKQVYELVGIKNAAMY